MSPQAALAWTGLIVVVAAVVLALNAVFIEENSKEDYETVRKQYKTRMRWAWILTIGAGVMWIIAIWAEALVIAGRDYS